MDRLPLSSEDGDAGVLWRQRLPLPGGSATDDWRAVHELDVGNLTGGYLRLFAEADGIEMALLDPELESLCP
jgi:hypothetical protein